MYERHSTIFGDESEGEPPVTYRTQKLSLSAPMVLSWTRLGRVGRRRVFLILLSSVG